MSLMPYWIRHLRNAIIRDPVMRALEDPFGILSRDPYFRDPTQFFKCITTPSDHVEGVFSDAEVKSDGKKIEIHLDVKNFTPEQIDVKSVGNEITVKGEKEINRKDGWTKSNFERRFLLPEGFPPERVECHFDQGKLVLIAFRFKPLEERSIPVQKTTSEDQSKNKV